MRTSEGVELGSTAFSASVPRARRSLPVEQRAPDIATQPFGVAPAGPRQRGVTRLEGHLRVTSRGEGVTDEIDLEAEQGSIGGLQPRSGVVDRKSWPTIG
jgi:hypothetical protein